MGKGKRRERELVELYQQAGWAPYNPDMTQYGENDLWGLYDILAIAPEAGPHAVQVKSNGARGITDWTDHTALWRASGFRTLYAVPYDREGWRIIDCTDGGRTDVVDERNDDRIAAHAHSELSLGDGVVEWLAEVSGLGSS